MSSEKRPEGQRTFCGREISEYVGSPILCTMPVDHDGFCHHDAEPASQPSDPDDNSPGDIIAAYPDGTIVLDDGITTHNKVRAAEFLAKQPPTAALEQLVTFSHIGELAAKGLEDWKSKGWNEKWWKRIDGTPIPNDLIVCIAERISKELRQELVVARAKVTPAALRELVTKWREFADTDHSKGMRLSDSRKQGQHELMMAGQSLAYATAANQLEAALATIEGEK